VAIYAFLLKVVDVAIPKFCNSQFTRHSAIVFAILILQTTFRILQFRKLPTP